MIDVATTPSEARQPLVEVDDVSVHYRVAAGWRSRAVVRALDHVTLGIGHGEMLGLVGESGSGKTTLGRTILRRTAPTAGRVRFGSIELTGLTGEPLRRFRSRMQAIGQDPRGSLDPRRSIADAIQEPMRAHGTARDRGALDQRTVELLQRVGLPADARRRLPHEFSGGQLQRICIARALAVDPEFLVADEPVSSLDVSIQAQVTNLLQDLQDERHLTVLFISHNIAVIRQVASRVAVMYAGRIVESGPALEVTSKPLHPYTATLLASVPSVDRPSRRRLVANGEPPDPTILDRGCAFRSRCPLASDQCHVAEPPLEAKQTGHLVACWNTPPGNQPKEANP